MAQKQHVREIQVLTVCMDDTASGRELAILFSSIVLFSF